jgi:hypothetical protein
LLWLSGGWRIALAEPLLTEPNQQRRVAVESRFHLGTPEGNIQAGTTLF